MKVDFCSGQANASMQPYAHCTALQSNVSKGIQAFYVSADLADCRICNPGFINLSSLHNKCKNQSPARSKQKGLFQGRLEEAVDNKSCQHFRVTGRPRLSIVMRLEIMSVVVVEFYRDKICGMRKHLLLLASVKSLDRRTRNQKM